MDLLKFEYQNASQGSYNYNVKQLIIKIRDYRANVSIDEFSLSIPELQQIEKNLQDFDESIGENKRFYIKEIMDELDEEGKIENKLLEDIERSSRSIMSALYDKDFLIDDFSFQLKNSEGVYWFEFYGVRNNDEESLPVVKEIFRSICFKNGVIFIDRI